MSLLPRTSIALVAPFLFFGSIAALPALEEETRLELTLDVLPVDGTSTGSSLATKPIEIPPGGRATAELALPWPTPGRTSRLRLEATGSPGAQGEEHEATLDSWLSLPDGKTIHATRSVRIREGTTRLVEIFSEGRRRLILAVQAERITRPVVRAGPAAGRQVRFRLEIQRIEGDSTTSVETNVMDTFVNERVDYSFHRGQDQDLEVLRIGMRPVRLVGEVAEVEVEITGTLPGSPPSVLHRQEHIVTTRGASSSLTVASGAPPTGYRFLITPDF